MSYEVPNEEQQNRRLRKDIAENRDLIRFTPSSTNADTVAIGAGSHDLSTGVKTGNLVLNPERHYESIQISWTNGSGTLNIGDVIKTTVALNTWEGKFVFQVSGNETAGTGIFEPQWLVEPTTPLGSGTPRSAFPTNATTLNETSTPVKWTATYTNNTVSNNHVVTQSASMIMDKMEGGNPSIKNIFGAKGDGQFTTIKPKEGKTLVLKPNGNIDVSQDTNVLSTEVAILQFQEDNITPNSDGSWTLVSSGGGSEINVLKDPVKVATTANVTNLTFSSPIDGIAMTVGDRFLVKDQTNAVKNGIYIWVNGSASTRASDMSVGSVQKEGTMTFVQDGTTQSEKLYAINTGGNNITIDTTSFTWGEIGNWVGTATSDLNMSTYDILNVDRLKFDTTGSAVLSNTTAGINATADEMHLNVPDNDDFKFTVHNNTRFLITDTSTHIYTENGGANFERLRIDNTDAWFYGIALTPTTNTQLIGGSSTNEQWSNVYGNKLSILNNSSNVTTTTQGAVFTNATNGLTLKSPDLSGTNFGSATFTDKDGANRIEFNYDMSSNDGNAVFNYMRKGFKIRTNNADTDALLIYPRQNSFATNDVIIDAVDSSANGSISMKINSSERFRISMTDTTIKASTTGEINMTQPLNMSGGSSGSTHYNTISAGSVLPKAFGYTLGASGSGVSEKGWGSLYLTTSGSNADRGKITLNDYGNTYIQLTNTGYGLKLVSNDNLQMSSVGSTLVTAGSGNTITFMAGAGSATHTFQNNALSLGSGIDLAVNANLIDFTNRSTPTSSLFNDGAMYSKNVSGTTTPMWWDGTTETSMLGGGGGGSSGGVNSSYIWTNDETNEYDEKVYLSNATMGSSSGTNSVHARLTRNQTYYIPIYFSKACTITEIGYECTISGGSGVTLRYGLYSNRTDNQNYPYQLLDGGGGSDVIYLGSSVGATRYPMNFTRTLSVPSAGLFWVAINNTNNTSSTFRVEGGDIGGVNTVGHVYNTNTTPDHFEPIQGFKESESGNFNSTADDENQSIGYGDSNNRAPVIFVRVS